LEKVEMLQNISIIGTGIFSGCTNLKSVSLSQSLTEIPNYTFKGCTSLEVIVIPYSVEFIDKYAFMECSSLKSIYVSTVGATECVLFSLNNDFSSIFVYEGITGVKENLPEKYKYTDTVKFDGVKYNSYSDHEHSFIKHKIPYSSENGDGFKGHKCTACGALKGRLVTLESIIITVVAVVALCWGCAPYIVGIVIFIILMRYKKKKKQATEN
ncbi:MAG: leucine-rich repeat domain-containing protein, partial [Clostridia bacterium]|nr:leucine-rich repeat domain-containing protein [Clostridia bacterium]